MGETLRTLLDLTKAIIFVYLGFRGGQCFWSAPPWIPVILTNEEGVDSARHPSASSLLSSTPVVLLALVEAARNRLNRHQGTATVLVVPSFVSFVNIFDTEGHLQGRRFSFLE